MARQRVGESQQFSIIDKALSFWFPDIHNSDFEDVPSQYLPFPAFHVFWDAEDVLVMASSWIDIRDEPRGWLPTREELAFYLEIPRYTAIERRAQLSLRFAILNSFRAVITIIRRQRSLWKAHRISTFLVAIKLYYDMLEFSMKYNLTNHIGTGQGPHRLAS